MKFTFFKPQVPHPLTGELCLIVHSDMLLYVNRQVQLTHPDSDAASPVWPASELAAAARQLLPKVSKGRHIALALPNDEFVATYLQLPTTIAHQSLWSAVNLQLPTQLPGTTEPLALAVQPARRNEDATVALWIPVRRTSELFAAFDSVGLFLACVLPRALVALPQKALKKGKRPKGQPVLVHKVYDEDDTSITCCEWNETTLKRWLHVSKIDCESPDFKSQLEPILEATREESEWRRQTSINDWQNLPVPTLDVFGYAFTPRGAWSRSVQIRRRKKRWLTFIVVAVLGLCLLAGLGYAIRYERRLEGRLAFLKNRTLDVSRFQAEVVEIQDTIAPVKNFPQQNVIGVLDTLNKLIPKDTWLSSFRIETGVVDIEGFSPNAAKLLELLTTEKTFTEVGFSRPTRPERGQESFGIRFKLSGFDLPSYWSEYFDTERR